MAKNLNTMEDQEQTISEISVAAANTTTFILGSKVISFLFLGIAFIAIARLLGPSVYGIYVMATFAAGIFGSAGSFGIGTTLNKFGAEHKGNAQKLSELTSNGMFVLMVFGIVLSAVLFLLSEPIAFYTLHNGGLAYAFRGISVTVLISMMFGASYAILIGVGKGLQAAIAIVVESVFQSVIGISLAFMHFGAIAPIIGLISGLAAGLLLGLYYIFHDGGVRLIRPEFNKIKGILSFSTPIALSNIFNVIVNNLSLFVLGIFTTSFVIGNFGIATKVNSLFDIVLGSIGVSLLPAFTTVMKHNKIAERTGRFYSYSVYIAFLIMSPVIFLVAFLAKPFSYVAFSSAYSTAPGYILLMSVGVLIFIAGSYANSLLVSAGRVKEVLKNNLMVSAIEVVLLVLLVPAFKGMGLALLLFIIYPFLIDIFFIRSIRRIFKFSMHVRKVAMIMVADLITMVFIYPLILVFGGMYIPLIIVSAVVVIIVYPQMAALLGGINKRDIKLIGDTVEKVPVVGLLLGILLRYTDIMARD
ncbi:MAG: oligosaccharide flippase family protein [Candidatus Micrarchaeales archaeon]|jgi:O-antigen/teichoic acid export membrane protein|uniref:Polysaccharide biosynthesis protein n=1 Tax=Candidatus Micrarchaeum acidiphilum ARMAN-2 TaxID=425595 RepID=C7DIP2_MICA2|nr:MAG: polysaccharide biosynthesis protein [Candidatus Micrarchaeum acidiphilum ARMAN-2]MCW6161608.1 oligosaccharide flippase family protein [Candidatus Micrarchaeales archaeon]